MSGVDRDEILRREIIQYAGTLSKVVNIERHPLDEALAAYATRMVSYPSYTITVHNVRGYLNHMFEIDPDGEYSMKTITEKFQRDIPRNTFIVNGAPTPFTDTNDVVTQMSALTTSGCIRAIKAPLFVSLTQTIAADPFTEVIGHLLPPGTGPQPVLPRKPYTITVADNQITTTQEYTNNIVDTTDEHIISTFEVDVKTVLLPHAIHQVLFRSSKWLYEFVW